MKNSAWKSIVVAISDPYRRKQLALKKAAEIAARCGAHVTLFHSFMVPSPVKNSFDTGEEIIRAATADRKKRLQLLVDELHERGVSASCVAIWDFPAYEAIIRHAERTKADLVVIDSSRRGRMARLFLANTDWDLIRTCPCPVWFVRSATFPDIANVLVGVDPRHTHAKPSRLDDRLLATAHQLAKRVKARVAIAHAYDPPVEMMPTIMAPIVVPASTQEARRVERHVKSLVSHLGSKYKIAASNQYVQAGAAAFVLPTLVKKLKIDLLVMGAVSRSRVLEPFIGNTAEHVIDHVGCDILVVKPANFRTKVPRRRVQH